MGNAIGRSPGLEGEEFRERNLEGAGQLMQRGELHVTGPLALQPLNVLVLDVGQLGELLLAQPPLLSEGTQMFGKPRNNLAADHAAVTVASARAGRHITGKVVLLNPLAFASQQDC